MGGKLAMAHFYLSPWTIFVFYTVIIQTLVLGERVCNFVGDKCEELPENLNQDAVAKILAWYQEQSVQKPLKCSGQPQESKEFNPSLGFKVFESRECSEYEVAMPHSFRGRIEDFKYQGSGKFKKNFTLDDSYVHSLCFDRRSLMGTLPHNLTGSFKDGTPHGVFKVDGEDHSTLIGSFREGQLHSRYRKWNAERTLIRIGYYFNEGDQGMCWRRVGDSLAFGLCQKPENLTWSEDFQDTFVLVNMTTAVVGNSFETMSFLDNARYVRIDKVIIKDCMLTLEYTKLPGEDFRYHLTKNQLDYPRELSDVCEPQSQWLEDEDQIKANLRDWMEPFQDVSEGDNMWRFGASSKPLQVDAPKLMENIQHVNKSIFSARIMGTQIQMSLMHGAMDADRKIHGQAQFKFMDKVSDPIFGKNGTWSYIQIYVQEDGHIAQNALVLFKDGRFLSVKLREGVLHGPAHLIGLRPMFPLSMEYGENVSSLPTRRLEFAGLYNFENGLAVGRIWLNLIGGGVFTGQLDAHQSLSGKEFAFVYPDFQTAYFGHYENSAMVSARKSRVAGLRCDKHGMKELKFTQPWGPELFYSPPDNETFTKGLQESDPFEDITVVLAQSKIPGSGEGVFATRDIKAGQLACPYSGLFYRNAEERDIYDQMYLYNTSLSKAARRHAKKYSISAAFTNARIDIPLHLDQPTSWHPTMGPKVNTDFPRRHQNCNYGDFEHPVYGLIQGVHANKDIKAGEELFTDYGYSKNLNFPHDFPWYHVAKEEYLKEMEEIDKKAKEEEDRKRIDAELKQKSKKKSTKKKKSKRN